MKRRNFLGMMAGAAATAACPAVAGGAEVQAAKAKPAPGPRAKVHLAGLKKDSPDQALGQAVRAAALAATDFSWLSKGDTVFIKPAQNSGLPYPSTTSPAAVSAMAALLKEKGAGRVMVGDMAGIEHVKLAPDGVTGSTRGLMESSGMAAALQKAGAELYFWEEAGWDAFYEDLPAQGSHWKRGLMMPAILKQADHIVLMPRCGRHALAGSTLGLKCAVGYWRTDTRLEYHRDAASFQEKTAEANTVPTLLKKQRLVISAADKVLTCFGPDKGYVTSPETGLVIASTSVVAHDMVSLAWLLELHASAPDSEKYFYSDPYTSQLVVTLANHWVVNKLGGWAETMDAEKLTRHDIGGIWDDRVLARAFELFGGAPRLELEPANREASEEIISRLAKLTAIPA